MLLSFQPLPEPLIRRWNAGESGFKAIKEGLNSLQLLEMMMMMMINFISVSGLLAGHVRPTNRYPGCQRLSMRGFRFRSNLKT